MAVPDDVLLRRLAPGDAEALAAFYNGLGEASKRTFRPLDVATTVETCARIVSANDGACPMKYDLVVICGTEIVGWGFLWDLGVSIDCGGGEERPTFGLAVADTYQGRGLGTALISRVMAWARGQAIPIVYLTVVQDNAVAWRLYERAGFVRYGEFTGEDGLPYYRMRAALSGM